MKHLARNPRKDIHFFGYSCSTHLPYLDSNVRGATNELRTNTTSKPRGVVDAGVTYAMVAAGLFMAKPFTAPSQ